MPKYTKPEFLMALARARFSTELYRSKGYLLVVEKAMKEEKLPTWTNPGAKLCEMPIYRALDFTPTPSKDPVQLTYEAMAIAEKAWLYYDQLPHGTT
jgi:hypothetical protein